ncbi:MAG: YihY/virulence factor BrkB family protein [Bacteroidetes bacterium]|nr:YihY/virulence factor BrkB family protein [Bacteroidota bacterium]
MRQIFFVIKKIWVFFTQTMWQLRLSHLSGSKGFFLKQLRITTLAVKGFNEKKCLVKASALTFYLLFAIVPLLALLFAIAQGFGLQQNVEHYLLEHFAQYQSILSPAFEYADKMLKTTQGGLIAGIGILLLFYTLLNLLSSIENFFNEIWEIKKGRTLIRRITDYLAIGFFSPILLFLSSSVTLFLNTEITSVESLSWLAHFGVFFKVALKMISLLLLSGMFTFMYVTLPNTRVKFKSAFSAGIVAAVAFDLLQWAYVAFQIGAVKYNAIYGSFAALPLFLIWVQYSWYIILFGAELSFANQNVDQYELETEIENISTRYKRVVSLLVANLVTKNFAEGKPALTAVQIAEHLDMPIRLARMILFDFIETHIFSEIKTEKDKEVAYQPAISDSKLTVKFILDTLDNKGVNIMPIHSNIEVENVHKIMQEFDQVLAENKQNILVKDIL